MNPYQLAFECLQSRIRAEVLQCWSGHMEEMIFRTATVTVKIPPEADPEKVANEVLKDAVYTRVTTDQEEVAAPMNPPIRANRLGISRNSVCPCGSGRKFKKCCLPRKE